MPLGSFLITVVSFSLYCTLCNQRCGQSFFLASSVRSYLIARDQTGTSYLQKDKVIETFPEEFAIDHSAKLSLADGKLYKGTRATQHKVVVLSFGLVLALLWQQPKKGSLNSESVCGHMRDYLNGLDFSFPFVQPKPSLQSNGKSSVFVPG